MRDIGAPDEAAHLSYARRLGAGQLPVLSIDRPNEFEAHQPPLAYLAMAAVSPNPQRDFTGLVARVPDMIFGALTVLATFALAGALGRPNSEAIFAAAIVALLPMQIALSGAASNDPLLILLCTAALIPIARATQDGFSPKRAVGFALLAAMAIMTKSTGLLLLPVAAIALFQAKAKPPAWLIALGVPMLISAPWLMRNQGLYGDPLALAAFKKQFPPDVHLHSLRDVAQWGTNLLVVTSKSAVGMFGYMDIQYPKWLYYSAIAILGGSLLVGLRKTRLNTAILIFTALVILAYVGFNLSYQQFQGRYLFPALAPLAIWIAAASQAKWQKILVTGVLGFATIYAITILPGSFQERIQAYRVRYGADPPSQRLLSRP
ncbi:hypothetical protein BH11ARM2_BH11ARM2_18490 [soil metagenome]